MERGGTDGTFRRNTPNTRKQIWTLDVGPTSLPGVENEKAVGARSALAGMVVRRESWQLSWRGRLVVAAVLVGALIAVGLNVYPWLATTSRVKSDYLVVEGWIGDVGIRQAMAEFKTGNYRRILTSGAMKAGEGNLKQKRTYADWSAQDLQRLGIAADVITAIPSLAEERDRTYSSALTVKRWFQDNGIPVHSMDVVSLGPHARRTRLLYEKAFGNGVQVGIIAAEGQDYDPAHWWRTSEGVREVVGEAIAYVYARLFFHPAKDTTNQHE